MYTLYIYTNLVAPERCESNFKWLIVKLITQIIDWVLIAKVNATEPH